MFLKKLKRVAAVLMLTAAALSVTFTSAAIPAYATDNYTKTEKSMATALAKYVVDDLKKPSSFQIVKIEKGDMSISTKGMQDYVDSPYKYYEYRVKYKAKNSLGDYVFAWVYFTTGMKVWQPDKYKYYVAVDADDAKSVGQDMIDDVSKLTSEYYKELKGEA